MSIVQKMLYPVPKEKRDLCNHDHLLSGQSASDENLLSALVTSAVDHTPACLHCEVQVYSEPHEYGAVQLESLQHQPYPRKLPSYQSFLAYSLPLLVQSQH